MKLEFFFLRFYVIHEEYPLVCLITFLLYLRIQHKPAAVNPIDYHPSIKMFDDSIEHRCLDLIRIEDYIRAYLKILGVIFRMANVYFKEKKKNKSHHSISPDLHRFFSIFLFRANKMYLCLRFIEFNLRRTNILCMCKI